MDLWLSKSKIIRMNTYLVANRLVCFQYQYRWLYGEWTMLLAVTSWFIEIFKLVRQISGMTLLGLPVEVYANGTQQWASIISVIGVGLALNYIYLPVFYDLQCTTCFTYLELRFDGQVKKLVSFLYTVSMLLFIPTVIYIPAIAFNQGMFSIESNQLIELASNFISLFVTP